MTNKLLLLSLLSVFSLNNAQDKKQRKNDIIADPILLIAIPLANVSYERLISENMGLGLNAMLTLSSNNESFKQFSPYFRYYLGKKYASGFFFEGFVPVTLQRNEVYNYFYDQSGSYQYRYDVNENFTSIGIGFGVGGKWVINDRLIIEASGGLARRIGDFDNDNVGAVTGKFMGGVGYRF
ncbi:MULTISPECIES: DUF3575 domain-containing protein [Chryseobacterium]|uniref:DUF3575 domain-containing protein n=1 Tax=Chryseobacterium TaxID=59732 RepID=UPI000E243A19|nr:MULTISPECIES: DUF3575 domain-containing protein [Chryseobacterium]REC39721.1 hypothetical protein DRF69_21915 [Chryseobacterium sp. 5_R23647]